jgi:hypothetical protein
VQLLRERVYEAHSEATAGLDIERRGKTDTFISYRYDDCVFRRARQCHPDPAVSSRIGILRRVGNKLAHEKHGWNGTIGTNLNSFVSDHLDFAGRHRLFEVLANISEVRPEVDRVYSIAAVQTLMRPRDCGDTTRCLPQLVSYIATVGDRRMQVQH